jgi:hypothetical protein
MANLRNIFRKIMASAFFMELLAATHSPRKNPALPHEKLRAFSLPQDSPVQLMFGAARFGEPALSASRGLGFHIALRRRHSPQRLGTPRKCFNRHRIFDTTGRLAAPCSLNACIGAAFRKHRALEDAACLWFAARRLKFAARLVIRAPRAGPCGLSASTDSQFVIRRNRIF